MSQNYERCSNPHKKLIRRKRIRNKHLRCIKNVLEKNNLIRLKHIRNGLSPYYERIRNVLVMSLFIMSILL